MKKEQPIGIFDSGIGGLTVAKAIADMLPNEQLIYFGDTAHFPYGDKSQEAIQSYAEGISKFLLEQNCKAIIIACNTASSFAADYLKDLLPGGFPLIDVIHPVASFISKTNYDRVGVIATKGTIGSDVYAKSVNSIDPAVKVKSLATPLLAPMIEEAFFDNSIAQTVINEYLSQPILNEIQSLILGCTHYPLIEEEVKSYYTSVSKEVFVVNSAKVVADEVNLVLKNLDLLSEIKSTDHHFYVSDFTDSFEKSTKIFFGNELKLEKKNIWE